MELKFKHKWIYISTIFIILLITTYPNNSNNLNSEKCNYNITQEKLQKQINLQNYKIDSLTLKMNEKN